jgi:hypothetical protein
MMGGERIAELEVSLADALRQRDRWKQNAFEELATTASLRAELAAVTFERDELREKVEAVRDTYTPLYMALAKYSRTLPEDIYRLANDTFLKFEHMAND